MSDKPKKWWEDEDSFEPNDEHASPVAVEGSGELEPIRDRANQGAILAAVDALITIRAYKAVQVLEGRVSGLEEKLSTITMEAPPEVSETVSIGDFEMEIEDLLQLPDEALGKVIACAQELIEDAELADGVKELLSPAALIALQAQEEEEEEEADEEEEEE